MQIIADASAQSCAETVHQVRAKYYSMPGLSWFPADRSIWYLSQYIHQFELTSGVFWSLLCTVHQCRLARLIALPTRPKVEKVRITQWWKLNQNWEVTTLFFTLLGVKFVVVREWIVDWTLTLWDFREVETIEDIPAQLYLFSLQGAIKLYRKYRVWVARRLRMHSYGQGQGVNKKNNPQASSSYSHYWYLLIFLVMSSFLNQLGRGSTPSQDS